MISGNQSWSNAIVAQQKQPLYVFEIPDLSLYIASFFPAAMNVSVTIGYGVVLYGLGEYGT